MLRATGEIDIATVAVLTEVLEARLRAGGPGTELLPVHQFVHDSALAERGLSNYWGSHREAPAPGWITALPPGARGGGGRRPEAGPTGPAHRRAPASSPRRRSSVRRPSLLMLGLLSA